MMFPAHLPVCIVGVFKEGGREMTDADEVAMGLYVKRAGEWIKLDREGCACADSGAVEQGCKPGYGK